MFLLNSVGSASMWMILALGCELAEVPRRAVGEPDAHGEQEVALADELVGLGPSVHPYRDRRERGWSSGKSPLPWSVVMTGAMRSSASAVNGWAASAILIPASSEEYRPLGLHYHRRPPARRPGGRPATLGL